MKVITGTRIIHYIDEGYYRNTYYTLHFVSTFVLVFDNKAELDLQYFHSKLNNKYRK